MRPKPFRPAFDNEGLATRGVHSGTHAKDLPGDYVTWCSENVDGWRLQYEAALKGEPIPKPKLIPRNPMDKFVPDPIRSSQGAKAGSMKNAGLDAPGKKKFTWRSKR